MSRKCVICGKEFYETRGGKITCSEECNKLNRQIKDKEYRENNKYRTKKKSTKKKNPEEVDSLTAKCIRAKEEGFESYGQLQTKETWDWIRENGYGIGGAW